MRFRGSITGPLVVIAIGVLFLIHAVSPAFRIGELLARYWPFLLIGWGLVQIVEISFRFLRGGPLPINGISGQGWFFVLLVCSAGLVTYEVRRPDNWWRRAGFERGVEAFGEGHDYPFDTVAKSVGKSPRLIIENFRGDAKITGTDSAEVVVSGHKMIRAFDKREADRANAQTPVDVVAQGNTIIIRANQQKASSRTPVSTNLDISVPRSTVLEATGALGDFSVSSLSGNVDISSDNAGLRLQDLDGNVKVDTRRSDLVRCTNVKGTVDLRGHGTDVELTKIAGQVTINGDYSGSISLRELSKPVKVESMRTELNVEQIPGEIRLERGSVSLQNVIGPLRLNTRSSDVSVDGFTNGLDLSVDKGDIELRPGHLPLGKMSVRTRSGNIELALPQLANFALSAVTGHGAVDNSFGEALKERSEGPGAKLEGSVGVGPDVNLTTNRGSITIRKAGGETGSTTKVSAVEKRDLQNLPQISLLKY